jgi:photosystem II stability/assembly factor-like uncharacterized protein
MKNKWRKIVEVILLALVSVLSLLYATSWFSTGQAATGLKVAESVEAPSVTAIVPDSAPNDLDTPIVITGTGFIREVSDTSVITLPTISLNGAPLVDVGWMSSTELTATAPWGLDPGIYTITVTNPDGQSGSLAGAFTITQGIGVWTTGGPYGGAVTTLLLNPETTTTLYATVPAAGSGIGLFRSVDSGANWELIVADIGSQFHAADLSVPTPAVIYLHKWGEGLYRSDDGGNHWITLPFPDPNCSALRPFAHPVDSRTVYVATDCAFSGGIYKSENQGASWITVTEGLTDTHVTALAFDPVNPKVMFAGTASGNVFHSINGGANWTPIGKPDQFISNLAVNPFGSHEPWAAGADDSGHFGYLWKYVGDNWVQVSPGAGGENITTSITFSPGVSGTMWIGTLQGSLKSIDGGNTWESIGAPSHHVNALAIDPEDSRVIYLGYNGTGLAKTIDGGTSWTEINQGLTGVYPTGLAIHPIDPASVYATAHGTGTFKTNNGGGSWLMLPSDNLVPRTPVVDPFNPKRVYIGTNSGVCSTENDGITWNCTTPAPPPLYELCCGVELMTLLGVQQPGHLVMGVGFLDNNALSFEFVGGGVYTSTDYGESWKYIDVGQVIAPVAVLASDPLNPTTIYAGTDNRTENNGTGVWKSEDGGETWSPSGLPDKRITGIAVDPFNSQLIYAVSLQQFYVSSNGGATWVLRATQDSQDFGIDKLLVAPTTPPAIYLYGWRGLIRSLDGGLHWERAAGSLGYTNIGSMAMTTMEGRVVLYVGTGGGTVTEMDQGILRLASTNDTLVNAGVYRNIIQTTNLYLHQYLPLVRR